jgi:hypothetical protein
MVDKNMVVNRVELEPMISGLRGRHLNHYATVPLRTGGRVVMKGTISDRSVLSLRPNGAQGLWPSVMTQFSLEH